MTAICRSCGARILWVRTKAGKAMPLNEVPVPEGNVIISMGPARGQQTAIVESKEESAARRANPIDVARVAFVPHWATCPSAQQHRRGG